MPRNQRVYSHTDIDGTPIYKEVVVFDHDGVRKGFPEVGFLLNRIETDIDRLFVLVNPTEDEVEEEMDSHYDMKPNECPMLDPESPIGKLNLAWGALDQREWADEESEANNG